MTPSSYLKSAAFALALAVSAPAAPAQSWLIPSEIDVGLMFTDHDGYPEGIIKNETHLYVAARWDGLGTNDHHALFDTARLTSEPWTGSLDPVATAYHNSIDKASVFLGGQASYGPLFVDLGGATGYSGDVLIPFARVGVSLTDHVDFFYITDPSSEGGNLRHVFGLQVALIQF